MQRQGQTIAFIQALRGVAALLVVLFHGSRFLSPYGTGIGNTLFGHGGTTGVHLFFILSGFIMTYTTPATGPAVVRPYMIKRFTRIWPTYVIWSLTYWVVSALVTNRPLFNEPNVTKRLISTLTFIPSPGTPPLFTPPLLPVGWTLNFEIYFYLAFGLACLFKQYRWPAFFGWMFTWLLIIPGVRGTLTFDDANNQKLMTAYFILMSNPLVWLFISGVVIGLIFRSRFAVPSRVLAQAAVIVAFALFGLQYTNSLAGDAQVWLSLLTIGPAVLLLCLASKSLALQVPRALVYLGDISFSMYLVHPLVQEVLPLGLPSLGLSGLGHGVFLLTVTTLVTGLIAALSHRFFERNLSDALKDRLLRQRPRVQPVVAS